MTTSDPIADIIGDYRAFAAMQRDRLLARGIDISPYALSHLAVRVAEWDLYVHQRTLLERHARANLENVWNGRPISLIVLAEPLDVLDGTPLSRIELIPPVHQRVYRMGLEHLGVVVGEEIDEFSRVHRTALTGQQFQSPDVEPVYVLFEDFTHVKFYRRSFFDVVEDEEDASTASATSTTGCRSGGHRHRTEPAAAVVRDKDNSVVTGAPPPRLIEPLATSESLRNVNQSSTVVPTVLWMNASGKRAASW